MGDLEANIARAETAVRAAPVGHPDRARLLDDLGKYLCSRYERTGNVQDLGAAIVRLEEGLEAALEVHPEHASLLNNPGLCFSYRYDRAGNAQGLEAVIDGSEAAV